jgi:excisionase family DNA binding protein
MTEQILVSATEAAKALGIGRTTFYKHVKTGALPKPRHIGRCARWPLAEIRKCLGVVA